MPGPSSWRIGCVARKEQGGRAVDTARTRRGRLWLRTTRGWAAVSQRYRIHTTEDRTCTGRGDSLAAFTQKTPKGSLYLLVPPSKAAPHRPRRTRFSRPTDSGAPGAGHTPTCGRPERRASLAAARLSVSDLRLEISERRTQTSCASASKSGVPRPVAGSQPATASKPWLAVRPSLLVPRLTS